MNKNKLTLGGKSTKKERIVVVGGGLAGLRAAERVRELGFTGELAIIGAERRRPYHRPALSKQMLTGELRPKDLTLHSYVPLDARWRRGAYVMKLDTRRHMLEMAGDEEIRYDGLIIATGVQARTLEGAPRHDPRVHVLRTMGDAIALQRSIATGNGKVVVIGGGFTAGEVASTCRDLGCDVTIVSRSKVLLGKVVGNEMGEQIAEMHRASGIRIEAGVQVTDWNCQPWGISMHLSNDKVITAGTVVLAVGSTPAVQWLRGSGLTLEDGVLCRPTCHVVGANDIVAAGDVARWPNLRFEAAARRVEHWMHAVDMGRAAAENLLAGPDASKPFTPLPRFWSEQCGMHMQAAGMPVLGQDTVPLAKRANGGVTGYIRNGRLIGIVGQDDPRGMLSWTEELKRELRRPETVTMPAIRVDESDIKAFQAEVELESAPPVQREQIRPTVAPKATAQPEPRPEPRVEPRNRPEPTFRPKPRARTESIFPNEPLIRRDLPVLPRRTNPVSRQNLPPLPEPVMRAEPPVPYVQPVAMTDAISRTDLPPARREPVMPYEQPVDMTEAISRPDLPPALRQPTGRPADAVSAYQSLSNFRSELPALPENRTERQSRRDMRPFPRPTPDNRPPVPPSRQNMRAVPPPPPAYEEMPEHPSFPKMHPVPRPDMRAVPPPVYDDRSRYDDPRFDDRTELSPRPNMRAVPPPSTYDETEHPSFPSMQPVERPLPEFPDMPSLAEFEQEMDMPPEHPSFPSMQPVPRPFPSVQGARGNRLQDWQLGRDDRSQLRLN